MQLGVSSRECMQLGVSSRECTQLNSSSEQLRGFTPSSVQLNSLYTSSFQLHDTQLSSTSAQLAELQLKCPTVAESCPASVGVSYVSRVARWTCTRPEGRVDQEQPNGPCNQPIRREGGPMCSHEDPMRSSPYDRMMQPLGACRAHAGSVCAAP